MSEFDEVTLTQKSNPTWVHISKMLIKELQIYQRYEIHGQIKELVPN